MKEHRDLKALQIGDNVRMQPIRTRQREWKEGTVTKTLPYRSYEVTDHNGHQYRRNRRHLRLRPEASHSIPPTQSRPCSRVVESGNCDPVQNQDDIPQNPVQDQEILPQSPTPQAVLVPNTMNSSPGERNILPKSPPYITRSGRTVIKPQRYH